jgi:hypothetical protein
MIMWKNLAPHIIRQRLIIEGTCKNLVTSEKIKEYLSKLSDALNMKTLAEPVTNKSEKFGWAGWIHWESSGCHFYAWDKPFPVFSSDIYTCKKFDVETAVKFTKEFFNPIDIVWKEVKV